MSGFDSSVKSHPNYRALLARYHANLASRLERLGRHLALDYQLRIRAGRDATGAPQQQNKPTTQKQKRRKYGDATPLVADKVLSHTGAWRIEVRGWQLFIGLPVERGGPILGRLLAWNYRVPPYVDPVIPTSMQPLIGKFMGSAFTEAASLGGAVDDADMQRVVGT